MKNLKSIPAKAIICYLLLYTVVSCDEPISKRDDIGQGFDVIEIDSCQYIYSTKGYGGYLAHKGNCKNPIHDCR